MRTLFLIAIVGAFTACEQTEKPKTVSQKPEKLVEIKDGHYTEWYPGKKHIKYEGQLTDEGNREGRWNFYSEKGNLQSFTMYVDGHKNGHSLVKYPNGKVHYYGEYANDQMVGLWVNYDQNGHKTEKVYE
ncbi:MAG: hypothetical protein RLZZ301_270 [Bacteroidota bacterium]|jgi:antitoxin component YwqK of YwqJK toxin-antitoxin module